MASSEKMVRETMQRVLGFVKAADPKAQSAVTLSADHVANTRFACNEISTGGDVDETTLSLQVALGLRVATSSTNQVDDASLRALVERVITMAKSCPEDPEYMPVLGPQTYGKSAAAFDAAIDRLDALARARVAKKAIEVGRPSELLVAGFLTHTSSLKGHATSAGLLTVHPGAWAGLSLTVRTKDGTGSGHVDNVSRQWKQVDTRALATQACDGGGLEAAEEAADRSLHRGARPACGDGGGRVFHPGDDRPRCR